MWSEGDWVVASDAELVCPQCHQVEPVQKVSSMVGAGGSTRDGTAAGLAETLARPARPLVKEPRIAVGCVFVSVVALAIVVWGIAADNTTISHSAFVVAVVLWIAWLVISSIRQLMAQRKVLHNRQAWPRVERRWDDLYYCHRDALVFYGSDPGSSAPASRMRSLLFEGIDLL